MRDFDTNRWVYCIFFISAGILLALLEKLLPGTILVLLVLHFPVLLAGFALGPLAGAVTGFSITVLSCLLTGYPPYLPLMPMILAELTVYGFLSGLFTKHTKMPKLLTLFIVMLAGRLAYWLMSLLLPLLGTAVPDGISIGNAAIDGLPGILLILVFIPPLSDMFDNFSGKASLRYD